MTAEPGHAASEAGAKTADILLAADFGVVGDGVTDDGPAISEAVRAAVERQATLRFEAGKTYYVGTATNTAAVFRSPFSMKDASGGYAGRTGRHLPHEAGTVLLCFGWV